jgi:hypothetical protein
MLKKVLPAVIILATIPFSADAKTLYVDRANGNDSTSYADNGPSTPWATIGRAAWGSTNRSSPVAAEAARAGDTVVVRAGTYTTTGTNTRHTPAYNPVNAGTAGNPITFQTDGLVTLTYSSGIGPVIGTNGRNYITWRGFRVDEALAPAASDTGPVVLWDAVGGVIEYCDIDGNGVAPFGVGELHNGVRINGGGGHTVRYNYIHDVRGQSAGSNASAILVDQSNGGVVEHNEIANSDGVFFIKRNYNTGGRWIIRFNYGRDCWMGIRADQVQTTSPASASNTTDVYQNVLINITESAFFTHHYDGRETFYFRVVNNTVRGCRTAFEITDPTPNAGHLFWNNIVTNCPLGFRSQANASALSDATLSSQHNIYHSMTTTAQLGMTDPTSLSFASWQGLGQDQVSPRSQQTDPLLVNPSGGNLTLQAGSPARTIGVDRLDLNMNGSTSDTIPAGAYITGTELIGLPGPSPPRNLVITGQAGVAGGD